MRSGTARRYAFALLLALVAGLLLLVPSGQDMVDGSAATASKNASQQPAAAPRPHNDTAAYVPHAQLPADAPSIAGVPTSLRVIMGAAKRVHRTPDGTHGPCHGTRAPPLPSRS